MPCRRHLYKQAVTHLREDGDAKGLLLGRPLPAEGGTAILGSVRTNPGKIDWEEEARSISAMLPSGIQVVGIYGSSEQQAQLPAALVAVRTSLQKLGTSFTHQTLLVAGVAWDPDVAVTCAPLESNKQTLSASVSPTVSDSVDEFLPLAVMTRLTSALCINPGDASAALASLQQQDASFCVLSSKEDERVELLVQLKSHGASACCDLVPQGPTDAGSAGGKAGGAKGGKAAGKQAVDTVSAVEGGVLGEKALLKLEQVWAHGAGSEPGAEAPVMSLHAGGSSGGSTSSTFVVDVLSLADEGSRALSSVVGELQQRGALQLRAAAAALAQDAACIPTALHFMLKPHQPFPVTVVLALPAGMLDAQEECLREVRQGLHRRFNLAMDRPFFRVPQGLSFTTATAAGPVRLKNVHQGLPPSGIQGGNVHLVQGVYEYCHYMQDKFDDNGWGCMYRSYQTVVSWFRAQHYTNFPIQSHEEIQKMLVKMGDKPARFVGSKQWIGAMEAQMLLDEYLGVSSKILNVPSGHDLEDKGRELAQHFDTQGSPISIGGGVLAFTILGVHYNPETCQIKFLILDPHYTGSEDLSAIQNQSKKNACSGIPAVGWHDIKVFRKDSFYNLCLPQRPKTI